MAKGKTKQGVTAVKPAKAAVPTKLKVQPAKTESRKAEPQPAQAGNKSASRADERAAKQIEKTQKRTAKLAEKAQHQEVKQAERARKQAAKQAQRADKKQVERADKKAARQASGDPEQTENRPEQQAEKAAMRKQRAMNQPVPVLSYKDALTIPQHCHRDPIFAVRNPDSDRLVIVFAGMGGKFGLTLDQLYTHFPDPKPNLLFSYIGRTLDGPPYLAGMPGFGVDRPSTVAKFNELMAEWGVTRVSTTGSSIGTFGAVMYGVLLKARKVLAFGPVTCFTPGFDERTEKFFSRDGVALSRWSEDELDLALFCAKNNQGTDVRIFYSLGHEDDRRQGEKFGNTPGVSLIPIDSSRHTVATVVADDGSLRKEFENIFADGD